MKKRIISLVLAVVMVVAFGVVAFAEGEPEVIGTLDRDPVFFGMQDVVELFRPFINWLLSLIPFFAF